jgi:hypothetical protein
LSSQPEKVFTQILLKGVAVTKKIKKSIKLRKSNRKKKPIKILKKPTDSVLIL